MIITISNKRPVYVSTMTGIIFSIKLEPYYTDNLFTTKSVQNDFLHFTSFKNKHMTHA